MSYHSKPTNTQDGTTISESKTYMNPTNLEDCFSILQDSLVNHALRFLGQERMLRYLGVYSSDTLPKSLLAIETNLAERIPPIHRIPVEILGEIFTHYTHSLRPLANPVPQISVWRKYDANPFILGQVCGLWRHIVLTMPTLWQSLDVYNPKPGCVHLVELWLQRAGQCSLTVRLSELRPDKHTIKTMHEIIPLVVRRIRQWKYIDFSLTKNHQHTLSQLPVGRAISLQHAKVNTASWDPHNGDFMWRALHSSPVLAHVEWGSLYENVDRMPSHIPWAQLTHISLFMAPSAAPALPMLEACGNLVTLKLWGLPSTISFDKRAIVLPNLRTLDIRAYDDPGPFLHGLMLPNLTSLSIYHRFQPSIRPFHLSWSFREFLEQSSCHLKSFEFHDKTIDEDDLGGYLIHPSLDSLSRLSIHARLTDLTIISLTNTDKMPLLLPNLEKVDLFECHTTPGTLSNMVFSRLPSLKAVRVEFCPGDYTQDHASLQAMQLPDLEWL